MSATDRTNIPAIVMPNKRHQDEHQTTSAYAVNNIWLGVCLQNGRNVLCRNAVDSQRKLKIPENHNLSERL